MKKSYIADFIGTMALVIFGCDTAMLVGCNAAAGSGYLLTALAFGLTIVGMAYCIGNVSGCHINPSVSLGVLLTGGMSIADFVGYVIAQCLGALAAIFKLGHVADMTGGFGSNGLAGVGGSAVAGLTVEVVLAFFFVLTILGVISKKASHGSFAGLVIGLTLVLIHILGIGLTGTSVNPARSFGPALPRCSPATPRPSQRCGCSSSVRWLAARWQPLSGAFSARNKPSINRMSLALRHRERQDGGSFFPRFPCSASCSDFFCKLQAVLVIILSPSTLS